jgi:hypothetical protein
MQMTFAQYMERESQKWGKVVRKRRSRPSEHGGAVPKPAMPYQRREMQLQGDPRYAKDAIASVTGIGHENLLSRPTAQSENDPGKNHSSTAVMIT